MHSHSHAPSVCAGFHYQLMDQQAIVKQSAIILNTCCVLRPQNHSNHSFNVSIQRIHSDTIDLHCVLLWMDSPASPVLPREGLSLEDLEPFSWFRPRVAACALGFTWVSCESVSPWGSPSSGRPWPLDDVAHRLANWGCMWRIYTKVIKFLWCVYDMIWYGTTWYDIIQYDMMQYDMICYMISY